MDQGRRNAWWMVVAGIVLAWGTTLSAQELLVNTDTGGDQKAASVASNASGSFVVAWQTESPPGSEVSTYIRARRYGANGSPLGPDFIVNSGTGSFHHGGAAVAMGANGSFVVAWGVYTSFFELDSFDVRARLFGADGNPLGPDFPVNTFHPGRQVAPAVAVLPNGEIVIAWEGPGPASTEISNDIQVRRFSATGNPLGLEFRVNSFTDNSQNEVSVAALPNNGFLISWSGESAGTDQSFGSVQARRFGPGGSPAGPDFQVNTFTNKRQHTPAVATGAGGEAVIAWQGEASGGSDNSLSSVHAQLYGTSGSAAGAELQVNTTVPGFEDEPAAAVGTDGKVLVAWHELQDSLHDNHQIRGRLIGLDGSLQSGEFPLNGAGAVLREEVDVAALPGGDFVAVWTSTPSPTARSEIRARLVTSNCTSGANVLCLGDGRFQVTTHWHTNNGASGEGQAIQLTRDTGYFYFFNQTNVEMVLKVLNACGVNQHYWVFSAGLTNVEVDIAVTDLLGGQTVTYHNPLGQAFPPILDTGALATCSTAATGEEEDRQAAVDELVRTTAGELARDLATANAQAETDDRDLRGLDGDATFDDKGGGDDTHLLLNGDRFRISIHWRTNQGQEGEGHGVALTPDTGYFWFFTDTNVEVILKVLNACSFNQRFWVFMGGLTNVRAVITVEDTLTGTHKTYTNPQSTPFAPILDTGAFATCS